MLVNLICLFSGMQAFLQFTLGSHQPLAAQILPSTVQTCRFCSSQCIRPDCREVAVLKQETKETPSLYVNLQNNKSDREICAML